MTGRLVALGVAATLAASHTQDPQRPVFRASTDAVLVHVLVRQGSRSIADLGCNEFELRDNDVVQKLDSCAFEAMPLDIAVIGDESESSAGVVHDRITELAQFVTTLALPADRVRIIGFASAIHQVSDPRELRVQSDLDRGHTALTDAMASALMLPADPGRRRVALVLTDGVDSNSVIPKEFVQGLADRADTVVHLYAIAERRGEWMSLIHGGDRTYFWFLRDVVDRSGGTFDDVTPDKDLRPSLSAAIADVRARYLLRYIPSGVPAGGWHSIGVKVSRPGRYAITARRGYQRGQ